jgi:hypothetical protein
MPSATFALQKAIHLALTNAPTVTTQLGGPRIYDHVPRGQPYPYVTFAQTSDRDWSTGTEAGSEHTVTLHVWTEAAGRKQALAILDAIATALHDAPLSLDGHRLINLRREFTDATRLDADDAYRGLLRLRAVTEPL